MIDQIQLYARVFITGNIRAVTGLHIGGSGGSFSIGGNDNPVIVNPLTGQPYIPGSSLRGKMRSLTEKFMGARLQRHANVTMHTVTPTDVKDNSDAYADSDIANIYGVPAEEFNLPTRLIVRDVHLTERSVQELTAARTDLPFTEVKTEVSIDRVTSQANPRSIERVPAGAVFGPFTLVYSIYEKRDIERLATLLDGMVLLEDDYLGGSGSRGSGQIQFEHIQLAVKLRSNYSEPAFMKLGDNPSLNDLLAQRADLLGWLNEQIKFSGAN